MIRQFASFCSARIRQNQLRRLSSTAAAIHHSQPPGTTSESPPAVNLTDNCVKKMKALQLQEGGEKMLRLSIESGGCSGFQYNFSLDDKIDSDDRIIDRDGVKLVVDKISLDFVKGATIDYVEELIRSAFLVSENPNADGGCSCKSSFMFELHLLLNGKSGCTGVPRLEHFSSEVGGVDTSVGTPTNNCRPYFIFAG